jgi:hypothetical protein
MALAALLESNLLPDPNQAAELLPGRTRQHNKFLAFDLDFSVAD